MTAVQSPFSDHNSLHCDVSSDDDMFSV